ncbi:uncharacterized protein LOC133187338 [Saccostrea echinata]|uniref:uncharacterized protein LOC133187338 n=1 Tax=Saccostrea echinata TaxID=191078 RepID=UPI002A81A273|nr:uncharacterized protein LOC133187338 [Saccostrea echinata]
MEEPEEDFGSVYQLFNFDVSKELALPDFYNQRKNDLPMLIIVSGGNYGQTKWDEISTDQVMRFHSTHSVRRVLAREPTEANDIKLEYLSIPVNGNFRFQLVKSRTQQSASMTMNEVLESRELPVLIQFSNDKPIPDAGKNRDGSPASFLVIATHEEHFIQGNYLLIDKIGKDTAAVALSPLISVTEITGYKNKSDKEFQNFLKELDSFVEKNCTYPEDNCDLRIKKYNILDPEIKEVVRSDNVFPTGIYGDTGERLPAPPVPARGRSLKLKADDKNEEELYEHYTKIKDIPRRQNSSYTKITKSFEEKAGPSENASTESVALVKFTQTNMSVKEVGNMLKKLKLGRHVKKFKTEMIDGEILKELTRSILVNDFNFTHVEAIRLEKYIESGHVPE